MLLRKCNRHGIYAWKLRSPDSGGEWALVTSRMASKSGCRVGYHTLRCVRLVATPPPTVRTRVRVRGGGGDHFEKCHQKCLDSSKTARPESARVYVYTDSVGHAQGGGLCMLRAFTGAYPTTQAKPRFASSSVVLKDTESGRDSGWKEAAQWAIPGTLALVGAVFSVAASSADMLAAKPDRCVKLSRRSIVSAYELHSRLHCTAAPAAQGRMKSRGGCSTEPSRRSSGRSSMSSRSKLPRLLKRAIIKTLWVHVLRSQLRSSELSTVYTVCCSIHCMLQ